MAAASQLARRAGPTIYITLAFHRSPLTRHCLGPEARWPCGSSSHQGTVTGCEGWVGQGSPVCPAQGESRAWGKAGCCRLLSCPREEGPGQSGDQQHSRGGDRQRRTSRASSPQDCPAGPEQSFQGQPAAAARAAHGTKGSQAWAPLSHCPILPGHIPCPSLQSMSPPLISSLKANQRSSAGSIFSARFQWAAWLPVPVPTFPSLLGARQD